MPAVRVQKKDHVEAALELKLFQLRNDPKAHARLAETVAALEDVRLLKRQKNCSAS